MTDLTDKPFRTEDWLRFLLKGNNMIITQKAKVELGTYEIEQFIIMILDGCVSSILTKAKVKKFAKVEIEDKGLESLHYLSERVVEYVGGQDNYERLQPLAAMWTKILFSKPKITTKEEMIPVAIPING